jgi:hypothetical protein
LLGCGTTAGRCWHGTSTASGREQEANCNMISLCVAHVERKESERNHKPVAVCRWEGTHGKAGPEHGHLRRCATVCLPVLYLPAVAAVTARSHARVTCRLGREGRREQRHWYPRGRTWEGAETRVSLRRGQAGPALTWPGTVFAAEKMASRRRDCAAKPVGDGGRKDQTALSWVSQSTGRGFSNAKIILCLP